MHMASTSGPWPTIEAHTTAVPLRIGTYTDSSLYLRPTCAALQTWYLKAEWRVGHDWAYESLLVTDAGLNEGSTVPINVYK